MKKIGIIVSLLALLTLGLNKAYAAKIPSIVVIDVGAQSSLFPNIVTEVCIVENLTCPNGKRFMEGPGAANVGVTKVLAVNHGTNLISIINQVNQNVGIIPIKIVATYPQGYLALYTNAAVKLALDWVVANKDKYNIAAVSVSQGKIFQGCYVPSGTADDVKALKESNIPVIAAAGNDANKTDMMSIACLQDVISIGATDNPDPGTSGKAYCKSCNPTIARYSNGNPTFYLNGRWYAKQTDGSTKFTVGTSMATAAFAGLWVANYSTSIQTTLEKFKTGSLSISGNGRVGYYVNSDLS